MRLKFLYPLHILLAAFSLVWAILALVMPHKFNLDYRFLLLINLLLWLVTCIPAYLFFKGLQSKRTAPGLNAITGSVMIKLFSIGIFIPTYYVLSGGIPMATLLFAIVMYFLYSSFSVRIMNALNKN